MKFAERVQKVKPSPTLALNTRAKKMQAEGINVVNLTCGEPDFDTPEHIKRAGIAAIESGFTKYTAVEGIPELKDAIIRATKREQGLDYKRNEVIVTPGAKYAIFAAMQALLGQGDEFIVVSPYWVSYTDQALLCEASPVVIQTSDATGFKLTPELLERHITPRSKMIMLNSPSNPAGVAYTETELKEISKICMKHKLIVISDEIYDGIVYDGFVCSSIARFEGMKERTIIINGVSKRYAMTGWRMGFALAPAEIIAKMSIIQGQALTSVTSITQKASIEAYDGPQEVVAKMVEEFRKRRDVIVDRLNSMQGIKCLKPVGAFYAFPNVTALIGRTFGGKKMNSSAEIAEYLLDTAHVATVPGEAFGLAGYIRLSFATSMELIKEGLDRIEKAIN